MSDTNQTSNDLTGWYGFFNDDIQNTRVEHQMVRWLRYKISSR